MCVWNSLGHSTTETDGLTTCDLCWSQSECSRGLARHRASTPPPHTHTVRRTHLGVVLQPDLAERAGPEDERADDVHEEAAEPEEDAGGDACNDTVGDLRGDRGEGEHFGGYACNDTVGDLRGSTGGRMRSKALQVRYAKSWGACFMTTSRLTE